MTRTPCPICSQLKDVETSFYKYGWPEHDSPLPTAANSLVVVDVIGEDRERFHLRRCPICATLYTYQFSYDYYVNGSEDEEVLTRLAPAEAQTYFCQHAQQLEALRQEIDNLQGAAGSLGDYIDHGSPSPAEAEAAFNQMQAHRQAADLARQRLQAQVEAFRQTSPEILHLWAEAHCRVCHSILATDSIPGATPLDEDTARFVAQSTLKAWQVLPQAGESFIAINTAYLSDYLERLQAELTIG